jgi:hypothetical protein
MAHLTCVYLTALRLISPFLPIYLAPLPPPPPPLQHIDGINLFGLISIASLIYCLPASLYFEAGIWKSMWEASVLKSGEWGTAQLLLWGGLFYHLYNQVCVCVCVEGGGSSFHKPKGGRGWGSYKVHG